MKQVHFFNRHVDVAVDLLNGQSAGKPFGPYLKSFFKEHKKFGGRDRKRISNLCYAWFRLGYAIQLDNRRDQIVASYFTLHSDRFVTPTDVNPEFPEDWGALTQKQRLSVLGVELNTIVPLPASIEFSDLEDFLIDQLVPRPTYFRAIQRDSFILPNNIEVFHTDGTAIGSYEGQTLNTLRTKGHIEIQDRSSQDVMALLLPELKEPVWDCCAASGGKSLYILDESDYEVYASDTRSSILRSLKERSKRHKSRLFISQADLTKADKVKFRKLDKTILVEGNYFQTILVDAPCSGSGTWSRNPEFKPCFRQQDLDRYVQLQRDIVTNAAKFLNVGGKLIYLTCSVYKDENHGQLNFFESIGLKVESAGYHMGHLNQSDSMFYSILVKK